MSAARCRAYGKGKDAVPTIRVNGKEAVPTMEVKGIEDANTVGKCGGRSNGYDVTAHGVGTLL